jgi:hypothetical protein
LMACISWGVITSPWVWRNSSRCDNVIAVSRRKLV